MVKYNMYRMNDFNTVAFKRSEVTVRLRMLLMQWRGPELVEEN